MLPPSSAAWTVLNPQPNTLKELPSPSLSSSPQPGFASSLCGIVLFSATRVERSWNQTACLQVKGESSQHFRSWVPDGKVQRKLPVMLTGYAHHVVRPRAGPSLEGRRDQDPQWLVCPHRWVGVGCRACSQGLSSLPGGEGTPALSVSVWLTLCSD